MDKLWRDKKNTSLSYYLHAAFVILLFMILILVSYFGTNPNFGELKEGDVAMTDIFAPYDFIYKADIDEDKMSEAKELVTKKIPPAFEIDGAVNFNIKSDFNYLIANINDIKQIPDLDDKEKIDLLKLESPRTLSDETIRLLISTDKEGILESFLSKELNDILGAGILKNNDMDALLKSQISSIYIFDAKTNKKSEAPLSQFYSSENIDEKLNNDVIQFQSLDKNLRPAAIEILKAFLEPNMIINQAESNKLKDEVIKNIQPIFKEILVKKNEIVIQKGDRALKTHLIKLANFSKKSTIGMMLLYVGGVGFLLAIFMAITIIYFMIYEKKYFVEIKNLYLVSSIIFIMVVVAKAIIISPLPAYFIPISSGSMLLAILLNSHIAFIVTIMLSIFTGIMAGDQFSITITTMVGGLVGIYSVLKVRRRSQILKAGLFVGIANFLSIAGIGFLHNFKPDFFWKEGFTGFSSGIVSSIIVMGVLPFFEYFFKVSTNITLLELSDLNHPLLRQLVLKAPGTYHHSIIVGNLAEEACEAIGANSLLARVGAYYHDIGKVEKAEYFSENQPDTITSQHERLKPSMSSLVITSHVKDGVELAQKYNLNNRIIDFIEQHHGNGLVYYFYQKALEKTEDGTTVKDEDFRYPGPKPQTKETAIVLLADSVEAASRSISSPTPTRIKELVQRIINNKFIDGQLDDCDLTLKDLHKIANSFERILNGMFHSRIKYPDDLKSEGSGVDTEV